MLTALVVAMLAGQVNPSYARKYCPSCTLTEGALVLQGTGTQILGNSSVPVSIASQVADSAAAVGVEIGGSANTFTTTGAKIVQFCNPITNGVCTEKAFIDKDGSASLASVTAVGGANFNGGNLLANEALIGNNGNNVDIQGSASSNPVIIQPKTNLGGSVNDVDINLTTGATHGVVASGYVKAFSTQPVPSYHTVTVPQAIERSSGTASAGGALAVTFGTSFSAAPFCLCVDQNASPVACGISTAATTTGVTFTIASARADTILWMCQGSK